MTNMALNNYSSFNALMQQLVLQPQPQHTSREMKGEKKKSKKIFIVININMYVCMYVRMYVCMYLFIHPRIQEILPRAAVVSEAALCADRRYWLHVVSKPQHSHVNNLHIYINIPLMSCCLKAHVYYIITVSDISTVSECTKHL